MEGPMSPPPTVAFVEIVAKQKGCMMCDLAVAILEEIEPEFKPGRLRWQVVDVGSRAGIGDSAYSARRLLAEQQACSSCINPTRCGSGNLKPKCRLPVCHGSANKGTYT